MTALLFITGLVLLVLGGRVLVGAAAELARRLGVPPLLIGLTIVAWGTSAPELAFNLTAAIQGKTDLVFGNVVGANICNLGLVLGVSAIIMPLAVHATVVRRELPIMLGMFGVFAVMGLLPRIAAGSGERWSGAVLLAAFAGYSAFAIRTGLRERAEDRELSREVAEVIHATPGAPGKDEDGGDSIEPVSDPGFAKPKALWVVLLLMVCGLTLLSVGGNIAADAASAVAAALGMSQRVVGLTVVSVGTTLPELVTSITAIRRNQVDLAVGNAVGSCLFNAGAIFGLGSVISPAELPEGAGLSLVTMILLGGLLWPLVYVSKSRIARPAGVGLLMVYVGFIAVELLRTRAGG